MGKCSSIDLNEKKIPAYFRDKIDGTYRSGGGGERRARYVTVGSELLLGGKEEGVKNSARITEGIRKKRKRKSNIWSS